MMKDYSAESADLNDLLDGTTNYAIPDYQRSYDWGESQVIGIWDDLMACYLDNPDEKDDDYFLGPIVTLEPKEKDESYKIIDGQQRLVTLTLLFCAFRDSLCDVELSESTKDDVYEFINEISPFINSNGFELRYASDVFFALLTGNHKTIKQKRDLTYDEITLVKNYETLVGYVLVLYEKCGLTSTSTQKEGIRKLRKIINDLNRKTQFVHIKIKNEEYAIQVFQSLNSKGQKLRQADLIKSYLLSLITNENERRNVEKNWDSIMDKIEDHSKPDKFLYESIQSRPHEFSNNIQQKKLFKYIGKHITSKNIHEYVDRLKTDANCVMYLDHPNILKNDINRLKHALYGLQQINARYFRVPIIAALREWGITDKTIELVECLVKFFFIYRTIGESNMDQLKKNSKKITEMIVHGNDSLDEILRVVLVDERSEHAHNYVDMNSFIQKFHEAAYSLRDDVAKYILYSFERKLTSDEGTEMQIDAYEIEHIFPQRAKERDWPKHNTMEKHTKRLGNITLMPSDWNKILSNRSFKDKKSGKQRKIRKHEKQITVNYNTSGIKLNELYLKEYNDWTVNIIKDREKRLINDLAKDVWMLPEYGAKKAIK